ncbi:MAG: ABC transporter ATP-binding protein [Anaerolineales bacterium]
MDGFPTPPPSYPFADNRTPAAMLVAGDRRTTNLASTSTSHPSLDMTGALSPRRLLGLWRLMRGYRLHYFVAAISLGLAALLKTATYLLLRYLIDQYLGQGNTTYSLPLIALAFVAIAVFEGGFTFVSGRLAARTAEGIAFSVRTYLYDHIQRLPFNYHDDMQTGELISRATSDVDSIRRFFSDQAIGLGRIALLFLVNVGAIYVLNPRLAWISILVVPIVVVVSLYFFRRVAEIYERYQEQEATLSTTLQENLSGVRVVKAFARQDYEMDKFQEENWEKYQRGRRFFSMHALFWPMTDVLLGIQLLFGYYVAGNMAINGQITVGTYLAYASILVWVIFPMRNMGRLIVQMSMGMVSFGRVMEIVRAQREPLHHGIEKAESPSQGEVIFNHVSFAYQGVHTVLEDISFRCEPGQRIALLGSTGSGKTSLVNLLPRFYDYTSGSITLDGIELKEYAPAYLRGLIGIVEQEPFLFSRSIRDNITYGLQGEVSQPEVERAAEAAAIHDVILTFPEGYDTLVGERGVTLSGGQKQRIAIARTLLKDPRILILDDATSSVDTETEASIRQALAHLMEGRSSFIIAHRVQSVMYADLILVLDHGRIVQRGTHQTLIEADGLYRRIYDLQAKVEVELEKEIASASD